MDMGTGHDSTFAISGISFFTGSFMVIESAVHRMNFCAENPPIANPQNVWRKCIGRHGNNRQAYNQTEKVIHFYDFVLPKNNDEFRIWPQIIIFQSLGKLKIEQRYRAEFRFTSNGYRNRFRYRLGLSYPFGKERNNYKPYQISVSNELFFTNKEPYFERNRMLIAFNYKPSKSTTLQVGYLYQFDYKINDETGRDFLQIGYFIELFRKQSSNTNYDIDLKDN